MAIIIANFLYCFVSGALFHFYTNITLWGKLLLFSEAVVLLFVISIELKIYQKNFVNKN